MSADLARYFDDMAPTYDTTMQHLGAAWHGLLAQALTSVPRRRDSVLDLGCGTGTTIDVIRRHARPRQVTAVDISQSMLDITQSRHSGQIDLVVDQCTIRRHLAESTARVDLITAMAVLHFVPDSEDIIAAAADHLRPDGELMITYDPVITGNDEQDPTVGDYDGILVYRLHPLTVHNALTQAGLVIREHRLYQAKQTSTYVAAFAVAYHT